MTPNDSASTTGREALHPSIGRLALMLEHHHEIAHRYSQAVAHDYPERVEMNAAVARAEAHIQDVWPEIYLKMQPIWEWIARCDEALHFEPASDPACPVCMAQVRLGSDLIA